MSCESTRLEIGPWCSEAHSAVPNAVAILGRTYPPGRMRSIVFAILGALAPVGFLVPGTIAALLADNGAVKWIWFLT